MRILPKNLREKLKQPIGKLVQEKELIDILKKEKYIVSIGDQVTYTILKNDLKPIFCVVDFHTRRGKCSDQIIKKIKSFGKKNILIRNPSGTLTDELIGAIRYGLNNLKPGFLRIEVDGEEDLASLAVIYYASSVVTIIYGLPDKGVLVVRPTKENKEKVKKILDKM